MGTFLRDVWTAFRAARDARHRWRDKSRASQAAITQAARLALLSDADLLSCAARWGSGICRRELLRRGLSDPNEPPTCA